MNRGFTSLELILILALICLLSGLSIFNWTPLVRRNQMIQSHRLFHDLNFAKQAAILHKKTSVLCPTNDFNECSDRWENRYMIYLKEKDGNKRLLRTGMLKSLHIENQIGFHDSTIQFNPLGQCHNTGSLIIKNESAHMRVIFLASGRLRIE